VVIIVAQIRQMTDDGEGECVLYWWLNWPCRFLLKDNLMKFAFSPWLCHLQDLFGLVRKMIGITSI